MRVRQKDIIHNIHVFYSPGVDSSTYSPEYQCKTLPHPIFSLPLFKSFFFPLLKRDTCDHWISLCRGACCDSHVSGDGEDHHQTDVRLPEELHLWRWLWLCSGRICLGSPRPQSWAGTSSAVTHTLTPWPALYHLMLFFFFLTAQPGHNRLNRIGHRNEVIRMLKCLWHFPNNPERENSLNWKQEEIVIVFKIPFMVF